MKVKLERLIAIKDKAADQLTAEEIDAVNLELESQGFNVRVFAGKEDRITQSEVDTAVEEGIQERISEATADLTAQVNSLNDTVSAKDTEIANLATSISEKDTEITRLNALARGEKPPKKEGDEAHLESEEKPKSAFSGLQEEAARRAKMGSQSRK